jgi:hypothetical protein
MKPSPKLLKSLVLLFVTAFGVMAALPAYSSDCVAPPEGLVSWWPAEGNANDIINNNNGTLVGGVTFTNGEVGQSFVFDGTTGSIRVPASSNLDVGMSGGFTVEVWINPANLNFQELCEWNENNGVPSGAGQIGTHMEINEAPGDGSFWGNIVDTTGTSHNFHSATGLITTNSFQHLAMTYDKSSGVALLYWNGVVEASANFGSITPQTSFDFFMGSRPSGFFTGSYFQGKMDEPTVYNRALSSNEIAAIYNAGSAGKCAISCTPAPTGVSGWWSAEGNANDIINNNNGTLVGGISYSPGEVGQAFSFNDTNAAVVVSANSNLDVGNGGGFTLEAWINPTDVTQMHPLFEWNNSTWWGVHFHIAPGQPFNVSPGPGELYANVVDRSGGWHQLSSPGGVVTTNVFQHVALTYDMASGLAIIYYNGQIVSQQNLGSFIPQTSYDLILGRRRAPSDEAASFAGLMDEPTVYNRALSSNEIAAIYNAGSAGKCDEPLPPGITVQPVNQTAMQGSNVVLSVTASGTGPFSYQWRFNGINISGATGATLTLTNLHPYQSGIYTVAVTSPYGTVTSSNTTVTVPAQTILIYAYSGTEKITTSGQSVANAYSGELFFIPDTTNGTFVGWSTIKGKKQYWINPLSDYLLITVSGAAKQTYTVLGQAGQGIDDNGYPHLWSDLHKGQNTSLTIGKKKYFLFPNTLTDTSTHVYPNLLTGNMVLNEAVSNYSFLSQNTQAANNNGQTMTDLVNALVKSLVSQGYQSQ